jgi:outer membrane beta-barrel protein
MRSRMRQTMLLLAAVALWATPALAQKNAKKETKAPEQKEAPATPSTADDNAAKAERVNVESIKQKYWARGDESELGVVQNRLYSKEYRLEMQLFGGILATDPFLTVQTLGASVGFHFSEYLSLHVLGWKSYVSPSGALTAVQENLSARQGVPLIPDTNYPNAYYGSELSGSLLYGKLSVIGKAIIYYDFHLLAGAGITSTESGNDITGHIGVGQQVFLTKNLSLRIDYRLMRFQERLVNKASGDYSLGASRANWTNSVTLGVSFLFGFMK